MGHLSSEETAQGIFIVILPLENQEPCDIPIAVQGPVIVEIDFPHSTNHAQIRLAREWITAYPAILITIKSQLRTTIRTKISLATLTAYNAFHDPNLRLSPYDWFPLSRFFFHLSIISSAWSGVVSPIARFRISSRTGSQGLKSSCCPKFGGLRRGVEPPSP